MPMVKVNWSYNRFAENLRVAPMTFTVLVALEYNRVRKLVIESHARLKDRPRYFYLMVALMSVLAVIPSA